jgi:hypothetical protein
MKPYGYKKLKKVPGDGCPLCLKGLSVRSKSTKSANRQIVRQEIDQQILDAQESVADMQCEAWCKDCI